ncbi:MAG: hypothetical protein ACE14M_10145 [Terriglobales bacterium]
MQRRTYKDVLETAALPVRQFGTGEVADILQIPVWRLQKFLDVKSYPLAASGRLGPEGRRGSRRLFSETDVYRLGVAVRMWKDGFTPELIVTVLSEVEDRDLLGIDEQGRKAHWWWVLLKRGKEGPKVDFSRQPPQITEGNGVYYALSLRAVVAGLKTRMESL